MLRSGDQKLTILKKFEASGLSAVEFCRTSRVPRASLYRWRDEDRCQKGIATAWKPVFPGPGRPRKLNDKRREEVKSAVCGAQAARDTAWKAVKKGKDNYRRTRRPRLTLATAWEIAQAAGYSQSKPTFVRFLAEIGLKTDRKYWYRKRMARKPRLPRKRRVRVLELRKPVQMLLDCHRSLENQPPVVTSKPATLRVCGS